MTNHVSLVEKVLTSKPKIGESSCLTSNVPATEGLEALNKVHRRAYGKDPEIPSEIDFNISDYHKSTFQDLVLQEKAYEFIFEGKRWYDLKITGEDYVSGKIFDDSVCYSYYPIDLHDKNGVVPDHLKDGIVPTVPLRALIPKNSRNFIVAGRCVSSDRMANSALRVQASCMAMGQVAGATAALAKKLSITPLDIPINSLKTILRENKAIVP